MAKKTQQALDEEPLKKRFLSKDLKSTVIWGFLTSTVDKRIDYKKVVDKYTLIFLNTGIDAFVKASNYCNPKTFMLLMFSMLKLNTPTSHGLSKKQISFLRTSLFESEKQTVCVFLHCPPFFSDDFQKPFKLDIDFYFSDLRKHKLLNVFFLNYNKEFIQTLLESTKNVLVFTSHTHRKRIYILNKNTLMLEECSEEKLNKVRNDHTYIKFVSTLPLGALHPMQHNRTSREVGTFIVDDEYVGFNSMYDFNKT